MPRVSKVTPLILTYIQHPLSGASALLHLRLPTSTMDHVISTQRSRCKGHCTALLGRQQGAGGGRGLPEHLLLCLPGSVNAFQQGYVSELLFSLHLGSNVNRNQCHKNKS